MNDLAEWLKRIGLEEYIIEFKKNHITGKNLFDITESELKDDLKVSSVGHRKNFNKAVANLKQIYNNSSGKNSDYIRKKVKKFYEKHRNPPKSTMRNSYERFNSQRLFHSRNQYESKHEVIEEDLEEGSPKFETQSPKLNIRSVELKLNGSDSELKNREKPNFLEGLDSHVSRKSSDKNVDKDMNNDLKRLDSKKSNEDDNELVMISPLKKKESELKHDKNYANKDSSSDTSDTTSDSEISDNEEKIKKDKDEKQTLKKVKRFMSNQTDSLYLDVAVPKRTTKNKKNVGPKKNRHDLKKEEHISNGKNLIIAFNIKTI